MYISVSWVGGKSKQRPVSGCVYWVVERCWVQDIACVGGCQKVLVGGLGGSVLLMEVGTGGQLKWVSTSPLMCS